MSKTLEEMVNSEFGTVLISEEDHKLIEETWDLDTGCSVDALEDDLHYDISNHPNTVTEEFLKKYHLTFEEAVEQNYNNENNGCHNCFDCADCTNCIDCQDCELLRDSIYCVDCKNYTDTGNLCCDCENCENIDLCLESRKLTDCYRCDECYNCEGCNNCYECENCYQCDDCNSCTDCISLYSGDGDSNYNGDEEPDYSDDYEDWEDEDDD